MKKMVVLLLILALPVLGAFLYFNQAAAPSLNEEQKKKAAEKILGRSVREEKSSAVKSHDSAYIAFSYPAWVGVDLRDADAVKKNPAVLDYFALRDPETHLFIVIQVTKASVGRLEEDSSVRLRLDHSEVYKAATVTIDGHTATQFTKEKDGAEQSVFFLANGHEYTVAATALVMFRIEEVMKKITETMKIK